MTRLLVICVAALIAFSMPIAHAQQGVAQAEKLLASAQHKAAIDGDLKGAIEDYRKAIAAAGNNRPLVAQALLRMAECHRQLGSAEAQAIYARLLRDYSDQKDIAAAARTRLTGTVGRGAVRGDRSLWVGDDADGFGTISPDGRYLTYTAWADRGQLAIRDLSTGVNHRLTDGGGSTSFSAISRDGKQVAYQWWVSNAAPAGEPFPDQLRVAKLTGTAISDVRPLLGNPDIINAAPYDWSPDNKWIAASLTRRDRTRQIALVDAETGSLRILKSLDWKEPTKIFFSPDGRYLGYDLMTSDARDERHVFILAVDGSREFTAVDHPSQNIIMGWSPDGAYVLFASDRSGSYGLWSVRVDDGRPNGAVALLKPDIAASWSLGLTATGTMYVWKSASPVFVQVSSVDLNAGKLTSSPQNFQQFITSRGRPEWSPTGDRLAYQSCNPLGAGPCTLWIQSMDTGSRRELRPKLGYFFFPRWSPDGRELLVRGRDLKGRNDGLYRIDAATGETGLIATPNPGESSPEWAPDGKHIYYRRGSTIIGRNIATGDEREAVRIPSDRPGQIVMSPDGRHVAYLALEAGGRGLFMIPVAGGEPRLLIARKTPERLTDRFDWTADGTALVIAIRREDNGENALWFVPVDGRPARRLEIDVAKWAILDGFKFDRSGKRVAFVAQAGEPGAEIRALENFLPAPVTNAPARK
jgi:Tol biopolymer transport system component